MNDNCFAPDGITVYGTDWCPDCHQSRRYLEARHVEYTYISIDEDPSAAAFVAKVNAGRLSIPTIVFPDGGVLVEPTWRQLADQLARGETLPALPTPNVTSERKV